MHAWGMCVCVCVCVCVHECARMCVLVHVTCVLVTVTHDVCVMCLIVEVFSFFIANIKKIGAWFFNFLTSWHTYWQLIRIQNKVQDKCAHLNVMTDDRWGIMVCSSVFKELSQLLSAFGLLWTIFFGQDDLLSLSLCLCLCLSLSLSLSLCLSVCLSVCLSLSLSLSLSLCLTHSNSVTVSLSLSLSFSLAPGSLFKNWHLSACSQKH